MKDTTNDSGTRLGNLLDRLSWLQPAVKDERSPERRRSPRLCLSEDAITIWTASDTDQVRSKIIDVSQEGLGIASPVQIPVGTMIAIQCNSGFVIGAVQRCEPHDDSYHCGVSLENCVATRATVTRLMQEAGLKQQAHGAPRSGRGETP